MKLHLIDPEVDYSVVAVKGFNDGGLKEVIRDRGLNVVLPWGEAPQVMPGWFLKMMGESGFSPDSYLPVKLGLSQKSALDQIGEKDPENDQDLEPLEVPDVLKEESLNDVGLNIFAKKSLEKAGYETLADIYPVSKESLLEISGVGAKTVETLAEALDEALLSSESEKVKDVAFEATPLTKLSDEEIAAAEKILEAELEARETNDEEFVGGDAAVGRSDPEFYDELTDDDLRQELEKEGLPTAGERVDLIARLNEFAQYEKIAMHPDPRLVLVPVESSNIAAIGYREGRLVVDFNNGDQYEARGIPADLHAEFMAAESKGKFYHRNLKNEFDFVKVGESSK